MQILISTKYRVVIPKAIRARLNIKPGQKMSFEVAGKQIIMTPVKVLTQV